VSFVPLWEFNLIADVMNKFHSLVVLMDAILGLVLALASAHAVTPLQTGSPSNPSEATSTPTLGDIAGPPAADYRATSPKISVFRMRRDELLASARGIS